MSSDLNGALVPFNKAIISLWFRAPLDALQRLTEFETIGNNGVLPLFTFGGTSKTYTTLSESTGEASYTVTTYFTPGGVCDWTPLTVNTIQTSTGSRTVEGPAGDDIGPSYLGVYKKFADEGGGYGLILFLHTDSPGNGSGFGQNEINTNTSYGTGNPTGAELDCNVQSHFDFGLQTFRSDSVAPSNPRVTGVTSVDDGGVALRGRGNDCYTALEGIAVRPDTWHHLLLSFDISPATHAISTQGSGTAGDYGNTHTDSPGSLSNPAKIWAALDDVNYIGNAIRKPFGDYVAGFLGPNDFASNNAQIAAGSQIGGTFKSAGWTVSGSWNDAFSSSVPMVFTSSGGLLPTDSFGIPVGSNMTDHMKHVEMAEFQLWIGKTLDTSEQAQRRLFIAPKKNSSKGRETLQPVKPKTAEDVLGPPTILLHTANNWKKGKNTGTGSSFHPSGKIESFKPEPEIGK